MATLEITWRAAFDEAVSTLVWSPDGGMLAVGSLAGEAGLFRSSDGQRDDLARRSGGVLSTAWSADGAWLAVGGQDAAVFLRGRDGSRATIPGRGWVNSVAWSPERNLLAVAAGSDLIVVASDGSTVVDYPFLEGTVNALAWTGGSAHLVAATLGAVHWFEPASESSQPAWTVPVVGAAISLAVSPDGERLAIGHLNGSLALWSTSTGEGWLMPGYEGGVERISWRPDGRQLAVAAHEELDIWELDLTGSVDGAPMSLSETEGTLAGLAFHPTLGVLASGGLEGELSLWATSSTEPLLSITDLGADITALAWSPAGDALAVGTLAGEVHRLTFSP